ncbi:MAG: MATE family efflux transporter [Bacteroidales bacterium]
MNRKVLKLAFPSILANITVPLVGMVDVAISGRLGSASAVGAIAIATMLFDLLYWNVGFLRVGTGGVVAQAYGRRDFRKVGEVLIRSLAIALFIALLFWAIQKPFLNIAFKIIGCSPSTEQLARTYFNIRIWAAPATLSLFVFKGWFIGMQNTISPMVVDIAVNVSNLLFSLLFALKMKMGIAGIALGTLVAQYLGLILSAALLLIFYSKILKKISLGGALIVKEIGSYLTMNFNLLLRSVAMLLIYSGFTTIAAKYGDNLLATATIMMKIILLYSYFVDGFAYAGEALTGRYIGAKDRPSLIESIKILFIWTLAIASLSTLLFLFTGDALFRVMTNNSEVIALSKEYLPWLLLVPFLSCFAFILDGLFIGATASKAIRDTMLLSALLFFATYLLMGDKWGMHAIMAAYMVHLIVRSVVMSFKLKKEVILKAAN